MNSQGPTPNERIDAIPTQKLEELADLLECFFPPATLRMPEEMDSEAKRMKLQWNAGAHSVVEFLRIHAQQRNRE